MATALADMPDYGQWREQAKQYVAFLESKNYIGCSWGLEDVIEGLDELMREEGDGND